MRILKILSHGFRAGRFHLKLCTIVYIFQLLLAMTIGLQVYQVIEASIGQSASVEKLIEGYDHTIIRDLINVHGASLSPLIGQIRWFILTYLIFSVFIHGGILNALIKEKGDWKDFWHGGAKYFRPFMVIGICFSILAILWTAILWLPFFINLFGMIEGMDRERPIIWILAALLVIWFLGLALLFSFSFFSRVSYIRDQVDVWASLKKGVSTTFGHTKIILFILLFFLLTILILYSANFFLEGLIGITTEFLILAFLVIQQIIVFIKIWLRIVLFSSLMQIN